MKEGDLCTQLYLFISHHVCFLAHRLYRNAGTTWPVENICIPTTYSNREGRTLQWCIAFKQMVFDIRLNPEQQSDPLCNSPREDLFEMGTIEVRNYMDEIQFPCVY